VELPSGGSIVIDGTEALTAIDVNSGRSTRAATQEETALHTNLEAATEVARQLWLRDIGGLVVVDFIDMRASKNQRRVEKAMKDAMKSDKARSSVGRISPNGLLEINRQRIQQALQVRTHRPCPTCAGTGRLASPEMVTLSLLRRIEARASSGLVQGVRISLHPELADAMQNSRRQELAELEREFDLRIEVIAAAGLHRPEEQIEWFKREHPFAAGEAATRGMRRERPKPEVAALKPWDLALAAGSGPEDAGDAGTDGDDDFDVEPGAAGIAEPRGASGRPGRSAPAARAAGGLAGGPAAGERGGRQRGRQRGAAGKARPARSPGEGRHRAGEARSGGEPHRERRSPADHPRQASPPAGRPRADAAPAAAAGAAPLDPLAKGADELEAPRGRKRRRGGRKRKRARGAPGALDAAGAAGTPGTPGAAEPPASAAQAGQGATGTAGDPPAAAAGSTRPESPATHFGSDEGRGDDSRGGDGRRDEGRGGDGGRGGDDRGGDGGGEGGAHGGGS